MDKITPPQKDEDKLSKIEAAFDAAWVETVDEVAEMTVEDLQREGKKYGIDYAEVQAVASTLAVAARKQIQADLDLVMLQEELAKKLKDSASEPSPAPPQEQSAMERQVPTATESGAIGMLKIWSRMMARSQKMFTLPGARLPGSRD